MLAQGPLRERRDLDRGSRPEVRTELPTLHFLARRFSRNMISFPRRMISISRERKLNSFGSRTAWQFLEIEYPSS